MGYNYTTWLQALRINSGSDANDANFTTMLPSIIDYAEQRIYRELNLISTVETDTSVACTIGNRNLDIPNTFVTVTNVSILSPAGGDVLSVERKPLVPASRALIDMLWPSSATLGEPNMFAMVDQWSMVLGPSPEAAYGVEVVGTQRPAPLSAINPTTFLSERLPDLFMAASMTFSGLYQRNFTSVAGQGGNDPMMTGNWEAQYQLLKASADVEELRKRFAGASWTSQPISPIAQPQRG